MPEKLSGVAIGCSDWPETAASFELLDTEDAGKIDRDGRSGTQTPEASSENENDRGSLNEAFLGSVLSKIATICSMGVMPHIGSFEKGKLYEMAPTNLPSI